jgi:hypothetical protein
MLFKNSVRTSKRTPHFTITKINWLTLFKEIIAVYSEKHTRPINTKYGVIEQKDEHLIHFEISHLVRILQYRIIWIGFMLKCVTWLHVYLHNSTINSWYDIKFGEFVQDNSVAYMIGFHIELAFR